jgi:AcrR family transcriptional regulator
VATINAVSPNLAHSQESSRNTATRRRLHDAARRAFVEYGTAAQIEDIVKLAGVARGTFYNYFRTVDELFQHVATSMAADLTQIISVGNASIVDPAHRIANGLRLFCWKAHADHDWGRFLAQFCLSTETLQTAVLHVGFTDIEDGIASGRFRLRPEQAMSAFTVLAGALLASVLQVVIGAETPARAGENVAELGLRALGLDAEDAAALARTPLAPFNG